MKKLFILLVVIMFAVSMASIGIGCKEAEEVAAPVEEEVTEEVEEEVAEEEAPVEEATGEPKTIVWWSMYNEMEPQAIAIKGWVEEYKKVHPEITVKVNFVGREVTTKVIVARSGGEVIDLVDADSCFLAGTPLLTEDLGYIMNEALDSPNYEGDKSWRDGFIPGTIEQYAYADGRVVIIPYAFLTNGFSYNKTLWNKNGWTVPKTWDEFLALCETIKTTSDIAPITQDAAVDFYNDMWNYQIMEKLKGPGSILGAAEDKTGESWNDPAFKQAIEMERELFDKGYFVEGCAGFTWPAGQLLLVSGEGAMELCGTWLPNELDPQVSDDWEWGFFAFPEVSGGVGKINDIESYTMGWAVFNDTKVAPEVVDFLKFCTSVENAQYFVDESRYTAATVGIKYPPQLADVEKAVTNAKILFDPHDGLSSAYADYHKNIYLKNHNRAFLGEITPDEYAKLMKEETIAYWESQ